MDCFRLAKAAGFSGGLCQLSTVSGQRLEHPTPTAYGRAAGPPVPASGFHSQDVRPALTGLSDGRFNKTSERPRGPFRSQTSDCWQYTVPISVDTFQESPLPKNLDSNTIRIQLFGLTSLRSPSIRHVHFESNGLDTADCMWYPQP